MLKLPQVPWLFSGSAWSIFGLSLSSVSSSPTTFERDRFFDLFFCEDFYLRRSAASSPGGLGLSAAAASLATTSSSYFSSSSLTYEAAFLPLASFLSTLALPAALPAMSSLLSSAELAVAGLGFLTGGGGGEVMGWGFFSTALRPVASTLSSAAASLSLSVAEFEGSVCGTFSAAPPPNCGVAGFFADLSGYEVAAEPDVCASGCKRAS